MALYKIIFLSLISLIVQSRLYQHTKYQIASIQIPTPSQSLQQTNNEKNSKNINIHSQSQCIFDIESISFITLDRMNIHTTIKTTSDTSSYHYLSPILSSTKHALNHITYTLSNTIQIPPSKINDILLEILPTNPHLSSSCIPTYILLPIINHYDQRNLNCFMTDYDPIHLNIIRYQCQSLQAQSPNPTIFYP